MDFVSSIAVGAIAINTRINRVVGKFFISDVTPATPSILHLLPPPSYTRAPYHFIPDQGGSQSIHRSAAAKSAPEPKIIGRAHKRE
jgi:hypothetical protein